MLMFNHRAAPFASKVTARIVRAAGATGRRASGGGHISAPLAFGIAARLRLYSFRTYSETQDAAIITSTQDAARVGVGICCDACEVTEAFVATDVPGDYSCFQAFMVVDVPGEYSSFRAFVIIDVPGEYSRFQAHVRIDMPGEYPIFQRRTRCNCLKGQGPPLALLLRLFVSLPGLSSGGAPLFL
eukprot:1161836-Pelagomonas_calceolata.AAC.3